MHLFLDGF